MEKVRRDADEAQRKDARDRAESKKRQEEREAQA